MTFLSWTEIRRARLGAVCALALSCACLPAAAAQQQSATNDAAAKKSTTANSATAKSATAKTSPKKRRHKSIAAAGSSSSTKSTGATRTAAAGKRSSRTKKLRGQQKIDSERAQAIQEALIRERYLNGEATGTWNQASEDAMRRYQSDHGWQSKQVPDSRALIKLGLGPSKDHLLNPESAMTTVPDAPRAESLPPTSQGPAPVSSGPSPTPAPANAPNRR